MNARRALLPAFVVLPFASLVSVVACVDTEGAMDDYQARTATLWNNAGPPVSDASANVDADSFKGDYLALCLAFTRSPEHILRFRSVVDFQATAPGTGSLTMQLQPLDIGALDFSKPAADLFPAPPLVTQVSGGKFVASFGNSPNLPASTNPLTGSDWGIDALVLRATLTDPPKQFCANLDGTTRPSGLPVKGTVCMFYRQGGADDAPLTVDPPVEQFACPE